MHASKYKYEVKIILLLQLLVPILASLFAWAISDIHIAKSILWAGIIVFLPNMLLAVKIFRFQGAKNARKIVNNFYLGEFFKFFATIALFLIGFRYIALKPLVLFLSVLVFQTLVFLIPLLGFRKKV